MPSRIFQETLVFVSGSTPQIITETVYALAHQTPPVVVDDLHIITTSFGRRRTEETLIDAGVLRELCREYDLSMLGPGCFSFTIITDDKGNEIDDIRDERTNGLTGNAIAALMRRLADDPHRRLHCCLAGGRKTMSFYLGAALQLFGRPWDKLYHVLVTPEFESRPEFFYKPKRNRLIEWKGPDGRAERLNTDDAEITLAELPFIRLRDKLDLRGKSFDELVFEGQAEIDTAIVQPDLVVNVAARTVHVGDRLIEMVPVHLMLYLAFLRQKLEGCKRPDRTYCFDCTDCFSTLGEMVTEPVLARMGLDYETIYGGSLGKGEELTGHWKGNDGTRLIRQNRSKINRAIEETLNDATLAARCTIDSVRRYGDTRYGVRAEKGKVRIEWGNLRGKSV